jgi:hypothetical protein
MPCRTHVRPDGGVLSVCSRGAGARSRCIVCTTVYDIKLCDYPLRGAKAGQTCSRPVCGRHARHQEPDLDYCPAHARLVRQRAPQRRA